MQLDKITEYCLSKKETTQEIKFENLLCFCIFGKIFFAISLDDHPLRGTAKVGQEYFEEWTDLENFIQAPYFARYQWVTCLDIETLSEKTNKELIDLSYRLIVAKLPLKQRKLLGEDFL